jgi:myo-inositol 2-dehydrogenase/D-chiro-inositol 1-dehydrogenase
VGRIGAEHARALATHPDVDELVLADADAARASTLAQQVGVPSAASVDALLTSGLDGFVIAAGTDAHADLIKAGVEAGLPVFCEKPVAPDVARTLDVRDHVRDHGGRVQIGFQRRFDAGYSAARDELAAGRIGELRRVHLLTCDPSPPAREYIAVSGGIYRDMHVHDVDILRWVPGREVVAVFAMGANRGDEAFARAGDVDEATTLLRLDDGTLVTMQGSRYNGAGYDVRMELAGTTGTVVVGLDERVPLRSVEPDVTFPTGEPWPAFWPRFTPAYRAEMTAFVAMARAESPSPCTVEEALQAMLVADAAERSRRENRPVSLTEVAP